MALLLIVIFHCYFLDLFTLFIGNLNDLWLFGIGEGCQFVGGTTELDHPGYYGERYVGSVDYIPAGRAFTMHTVNPGGPFVALYGGLRLYVQNVNDDTGNLVTFF